MQILDLRQMANFRQNYIQYLSHINSYRDFYKNDNWNLVGQFKFFNTNALFLQERLVLKHSIDTFDPVEYLYQPAWFHIIRLN